jgi:hypothetical protein
MLDRYPSWVRIIVANEQDDIVYLLNADLRITECSPAWDRFAEANGGVGISRAEVRGRYIFDCIPDVLVTFYERKFSEALKSPGWSGFDYECSSPEVFRLFHMAMHPVQKSGLLVVNSHLKNQRSPLPMHDTTLPESGYVSADGVVTMCANCRRTRREEQAKVWDWVPRFLRENRRKISHGLCPTCVAYFYPEYVGPRR